MSIYLNLTKEFNEGRLRAIIASGQAVVLHRLAIMSKDGDWIVRERPDDLQHILLVLAKRGAKYRFGAPLDTRWLKHGWSSHFEFSADPLRVRTDFFTRPPRISEVELAEVWQRMEGMEIPFLDPLRLGNMKKTNREKDYPVIGELARLLEDPSGALMLSRSARDLILLGEDHPGLLESLVSCRPLLQFVSQGIEVLESELDKERRMLIKENDKRLERYREASQPWAQRWKTLVSEISNLDLTTAHSIVVSEAERFLPYHV